MGILLDAQLPQSLVWPLEQLGCDVLHALDLPEGNRTADNLICTIADRDGRVVFSKDTDFIRSHLLRGTPAKLLIVALEAEAVGDHGSADHQPCSRQHPPSQRAQAPIGADQGRRFPPGKGQIKTVVDRVIQVASQSQGLGLQLAIRLHPIH